MTHAEDCAGRGTRAVLAGLIAALVLAGMLHAQGADAAEDNTELAKKTQNPVADLISVPFQSNFKLGKLPINTSRQAYYNAERPRNVSDWQLRFQVQFLLPTFQ